MRMIAMRVIGRGIDMMTIEIDMMTEIDMMIEIDMMTTTIDLQAG